MNGVANCPNNALFRMVCPLWKLDKYKAPLAFSDYWKDPTNEQEYLQKSRWLADMNNEKPHKNATYKANIITLESYTMVEALQDSMVQPKESEQHGFYKWGSMTEVEQ